MATTRAPLNHHDSWGGQAHQQPMDKDTHKATGKSLAAAVHAPSASGLHHGVSDTALTACTDENESAPSSTMPPTAIDQLVPKSVFTDTSTSGSGGGGGTVMPMRHASAQVVPMPSAPVPPRLEEFHVGKMLSPAPLEAALRITPLAHEQEESYIPVALARKHLTRVVEDMHALKQEQTEKLDAIIAHFTALEREDHARHEADLRMLKKKAREKIAFEQAKYGALANTARQAQDQLHGEIRKLEQHAEAQAQEQATARLRWREELERALLQHEDGMMTLHQQVIHHSERMLHDATRSHKAEIRALQDQLVMGMEDIRAQALQVQGQLLRMERQRATREKTYRTQVERLTSEYQSQQQVSLSLSSVVDRVVDLEAQRQRELRSRQLILEIERLQAELVRVSDREVSLGHELRAAEQQGRRIEGQAVRQCMAFMVSTLEQVPETVSRASTCRLEPSTNEEATQTSPVPREETVVVAIPPTQARTDAATTPRRVETHEMGVETTVSATGTPQISARRASVESSLAAQALPPEGGDAKAKELELAALQLRHAELERSRQVLRASKAHWEECMARKQAAKARIKQWLATFQDTHQREPTIEDKAEVKELYLDFHACEAQCVAAKQSVAQNRMSHRKTMVEVDTLRQWRSMASASSSSASLSSSTSSRVQTPSTGLTGDGHEEEDDSDDAMFRNFDEAEGGGNGDGAARPESREYAETVREMTAAHTMEALEQEVLALRAELDRARSEARRQMPGADAATSPRADVVLPIAQDMEVEKHARDAMEDERLQERRRAAEEMEEKRGQLQAAVTLLSGELEERRGEKERLETKIEELRARLQAEEGREEERIALMAEAKRSMEEEEEQQEGAKQTEDNEEEHIAAMEEVDAADGEEEQDEEQEEVVPPSPALSADEQADHERDAALRNLILEAVENGKAQWNRGDKAKCFQVYSRAMERVSESLRAFHSPRREELAACRAALVESARLPPARGSMVLRRQLDAVVAASETHSQTRDARLSAVAAASEAKSPPAQRYHKKSVAPETATSTERSSSSTNADANSNTNANSNATSNEARQKLKALEARAKADRVKITQLEAAVSRAEQQLAVATSSSGGSGGGGGGAATVALERRLAEAEKRHSKALEEAERVAKRDVAALTGQLSTAQTRVSSLQEQVSALSTELAAVGGKAQALGKMEQEVVALRDRAARVDALEQELGSAQHELATLTTSYKEEQALRKKYYNQIEDMKGKIRVFARCRPLSSSEQERGCQSCVRFVDEYSLDLDSVHGAKAFAFDRVFPPLSAQEEVFADTLNLLQSAVDGFNVCIFAYGQTGSGKTFTMTGSDAAPGLSPRAIRHVFELAESLRATNEITFQVSMLELYNDTLIDLFQLVDDAHGGGGNSNSSKSSGPLSPTKLEIKKNERGMVVVHNLTVKSCTTPAQTLRLVELANKKRQVGATKMNAESSRSHSVLSLLVTNYNRTTRATSVGKLSLVDLAGSERAGKTGATADRLKEAQAINKSLSALGDVIAALSSGEKFIPYRNNKLTQLMQDSLGGNAKTLMFVNISPADYNQEETQTSLQYAARVKLITNAAQKNSESEQVNRLKAVIRQLRAGKTDVDVDALLD